MTAIEVPAGFLRSPRWWHDPAGQAWLADLPNLVSRTCERWGVRVDGYPLHGSNALVVPVVGVEGPTALRLTPGDGPVVSVVRAEPDGSVLLLERLDPGRRLADRERDEIASTTGALVARLAVPGPPAGVPSTQAAARDLAEHGRERWDTLGRPVPLGAFDEALNLARGLATGSPDLAVNGDVHAYQVLAASDGIWTVIDPLLMRGDPAYDLARSLWTLVDGLPDAGAVRGSADAVVTAAGGDVERGRAWMLTRTVDYWLWCVQAGLTEDSLRCARIVEALRKSAPGGGASSDARPAPG